LGAKKGGGVDRSFVFRVRLGEYEVEVGGTRDEVLKTIEDLSSLIGNVHRAFDGVRPKKVATLTVKTESARDEKTASEKYPRISPSQTCDEAVLRLLETDWGKWRPRTLEELRGALKANGLEYPARMLAAVLLDLVKQEKIRRWNTDAGYVYILAEKEAFGLRRDTNE
jgi:intein/homing endonuclease